MRDVIPRGVCVIAIVSGLAFAQAPSQPVPRAPSQPAPQAAAKRLDPLRELSASLQSLSQRVNRAVVQIVSSGFSIGSEDGESTDTAIISRQRSEGTGIILRPDGYIITNHHVVKGALHVRVLLPPTAQELAGKRSILKPGGTSVEARIVGIDRDTDLAVLKIEKTGLAHLSLGDSDRLRQGQLVMAFGNPLGLQNSVSLGVISSVARQLKPDDSMVYIQTDAPINPGNSGGPLVDAAGRVMGINTFILSQSGGSEGIGFAIPSNIVRNVFHQIVKDGHVHRGEIGISAQTLSPLLAAGLNLPRDYGVLVSDVLPDGPGAKAGMKIGDIVLSMDGKPMENARQLQVNLYRRSIGQKVSLAILRTSGEITLQVPVIEQEDDPLRFADLADPTKNLVRRLGILGIEISQDIAEMLPDLRKSYGIVVAARSADVPYQGGDLQPGDVIHEMNGTPITTISALRGLLDTVQRGGPVVLQVERDGKLLFLALNLE